jgi:carboxymethylenebutenolidase
VLGLYGGQDTGIPLDTVEKMKAALAAGGACSEEVGVRVYPDAPHAFHADYRPSYRKERRRRRLEALPGLVQGTAWPESGVA